ncbi:MAG: bifunctional ornithine acetyltransferase/N-acetylglutamate synthase, partial [bacterium]
NFGRILQAIGATKARVNWSKFKYNWKMGEKDHEITVNLAAGKSSVTGWGCDLTEGYITINARYHT